MTLATWLSLAYISLFGVIFAQEGKIVYQPAEINHVILYGQSNATRAGNEKGSNGALSIEPHARNLMFNDYIAGTTADALLAPQNEADSEIYRNRDKLVDFQPFHEGLGLPDDGETVLGGMLASLERASNAVFLGSCCGVGAYKIEQLSRGEWPYKNLLHQVSRAQAISSSKGLTYKVACIPFIQGEADRNSKGWAGKMIRLSRHLNRDIKSITGQKEDVVILIEQLNRSVWRQPAKVDLSIPMAHRGKGQPIYLTGPRYPIIRGNHYFPHGKRWRGCHLGEIANAILFRGVEWIPLRPTTHRIEGVNLYLDFAVPYPPLQFGVSEFNKSMDKNYGFEAKGLQSVEIVDEDTLRMTLANGSWKGVTLTYARQKGPSKQKGNLCDSSEKKSYYKDAEMKFYDLRNWCIAFEMKF